MNTNRMWMFASVDMPLRSYLVKLGNVVFWISLIGIAREYICSPGYWFSGWIRNPHPNGREITFEISRVWTMITGQHPPRYGSNTPFQFWSAISKNRGCRLEVRFLFARNTMNSQFFHFIFGWMYELRLTSGLGFRPSRHSKEGGPLSALPLIRNSACLLSFGVDEMVLVGVF